MNRQVAHVRHFFASPWGLSIAIFLLALGPRLTAVNRTITPDELMWVYRSVLFREALRGGHWLETLTAGHPGVTTTWLGSAAISLQLLMQPAQQTTYAWITRLAWLAPDNAEAFVHLASFLSGARVAVAVVNSMGVTAVFLLGRKILPRTAAWTAALIVAFEPFLAGLSGLLHVDALLTTFATLALLSLGVALRGEMPLRRRQSYTAVCGFMTALALLTKSPALLLPIVTVGALGLKWLTLRHTGFAPKGRFFMALIGPWLLTLLVTSLALFPALWVSPTQVITLMSSNANRHIEEALRPTFFMGSVTFDHGPLFYPVALAFRLSPVLFLGLLFAVLWMVQTWRREGTPLFWRKLGNQRLPAVMLGGWAVLFVLGISLATKKFDRYALPIFPAVALTATAGWYYLFRQRRVGILLPVLVQLIYFVTYLPYPLSAYSWIVGGPQTAQAVMPLGWGDEISAAARWLAGQPDVEKKTAVSPILPALAPFFPGESLPDAVQNRQQADYLIVTAGSRQGNETQAGQSTAGMRLLHTVRYGGLPQAWVYEQPSPQPRLTPTGLADPVRYGEQVQLSAAAAAIEDAQVTLKLRWGLLPGGENGRYTIKLSVLDDRGQLWAAQETPLLNAVYFYPEHWPAGETTDVAYQIDLPLAIPVGAYQLAVELFDEASAAQLPVVWANGRFAGVRYAVADVTLSQPPTPIDPAQVNIPVPTNHAWPTTGVRLLGHQPLPANIVSGAALPLDLFWQATTAPSENWRLAVTLGPETVIVPLSRQPVMAWRSGEVVHEKYLITVPPQTAAGSYTLSVGLLPAQGETLLAETAVLGTVNITTLDRLFELPDDVGTPLNYQFGEDVKLLGVDLRAAQVAAAQPVPLTLTWQVLQKPPLLYNVFVHLVGPNGKIVAQADRWPGGLPTDLWAAQQVIVDAYEIALPDDAPPGRYKVVVGMYTAVDGLRLPIRDANAPLPTDQLTLPASFIVTE